MTTDLIDPGEAQQTEAPEDATASEARAAAAEEGVPAEPLPGPGWWPILTTRREAVAYGVIFATALIMRLWDLGSQAVHHDESLHGFFSWKLLMGEGFEHNPLMHGVFLFLSNAGVFFLFGDNEYTMRVAPALFGAALVLVPPLLRNRLGNGGALLAAVMLAFSPSLLYFSRFARNDLIMAVWTLGLVGVMWRYIDERRPRYLYWAAAIIALGFSTKETMYLSIAILSVGLLLVAYKDVGLWIWGRRSMKEWGPAAGFLLLMITLTLPLWGALSGVFQNWLNITLAAPAGTAGAEPGEPQGAGFAIAIAISVTLLVIGTGFGFFWGRRVWLAAWAIAAAIFVVIMSTCFDHPSGIATGVWQSLGYWLAQQDVNRGEQPWYYYFMVVSVYEFLPWTIAIGASAYYAIKGNAFSRFLVFWAIATFVAYTFAGEKMPWLLVHVALPLIILSAKALGDVISFIPWRRALKYGGILLLPGVIAFLVVLWRLIHYEFPAEGRGAAFGGMFGMLVFEGLLLLGLYELGRRVGYRAALSGVLVAFAILMAAFTVRAGWTAAFVNRDVPREMLIYTQSSPELHELAKEIETIAALTDEREDMKITIDSAHAFTWPWAWYLRDYKNAGYPDYSNSTPDTKADVAVAVISSDNTGKVAANYEGYSEPRHIVHRWWFPEDYRGLTPGQFFGTIIDRDAWRESVDYFLYRELPDPLPGIYSDVYFRDDIPLQVVR